MKLESNQDLRDFIRSVRDEASSKGAEELAAPLTEILSSVYSTPGEFLGEAQLVLQKARRYLRWRYSWRSRRGIDQALDAIHAAYFRKR